MDTRHDYLMNIATGLFFVCYIPELYANYKNKNANVWNLPEKVVLLLGTSFSLAYGLLKQDEALIANYAPLLGLDILALGMRLYYALKNRQPRTYIEQVDGKSLPEDSNSSRHNDSSQATGPHAAQV